MKRCSSPFSTFSYAGLRFDYPSGYNWEASLDAVMNTWTITGNDLTVMVFAPAEKIKVDDMANGMRTQFKTKTPLAPCERTFGAEYTKGVKIAALLAGVKMQVEIYSFETPSGRRLVVLQNTQDETGKLKAASVEAMKQLCDTFRIHP